METKRFFATHPVFTLREFQAHSKQEGEQTSPATQEALLAYHRRASHLLSVRRGLYAVVSPEAQADTYLVDPYLVAARLTDDAVLAYTTALAYHGLAHSLSFTFYCLSRSAFVHPLLFQGSAFRAVPPPRALPVSEALTLGVEDGDRQGLALRVTGLERTLVDVLDRLGLCGGWEEVYNALSGLDAYLDFELLTHYALRLGNATTVAKVGYLLSEYRQKWSVPENTLAALRARRPKQPHYVERQQGHVRARRARYAAEWNLLVPALAGDLDYEGAAR